MTYKLIDFTCEKCGENRMLELLEASHSQFLKNSANGLVRYSSIHPCKDEIPSVTNLDIDANYDVRGMSPLQLPESAKAGVVKKKPAIPMPVTKKTGHKMNLINIIPGLNIIMDYNNDTFGYQLLLGRKSKDSKAEYEITSSSGSSSLKYFKSDLNLTDHLKDWLKQIVELIEAYPPTRLGFIVEAFRDAFTNFDRQISPIYKKAFADLLSSHAVYVKPGKISIDKALKELTSKFIGDTIDEMKAIASDLSLSPDQSLYELVGLIPDSVKLVFNLYCMKNRGIVEIERLPVGSDEEKNLRK